MDKTFEKEFNVASVKSPSEFKCLLDYLELIYPNQDRSSLRANASMASYDQTYLLKKNNEIVGSIWVIKLPFTDFNVGGIGGVTIMEKYRARGLGKLLVEHAIQSNPNFDAFLLWTRVPEFFKAIGFHPFEEGIEREINDSTPMLYSNIQGLLDRPAVTKWPRIKF